MADDKKDNPLPKFNLPPLPKAAGPTPPIPGLSGLPGLPPMGGPARAAVAPPPAPPMPPAPSAPEAGSQRTSEPALPDLSRVPQAPSVELQRKLADTEKRLQEEREKVLLASLRQQEEKVNAARVEDAIKDVQERLRRDRREAEMEETRLKLEARIQELEQRLAHERETWVATLKNQVQSRETQDREIEAHFTSRMQEMERRWLEEKAHWQKVLLNKEEEIRNLRALAEKLKGADAELEKSSVEKEALQKRAADLAEQLAERQAEIKGMAEHEKEYFALKADLTVAKEQARMLQEKLERELQSVRMASKEREERLMADNERLQRDIQVIADRVRAEAEIEVRKHRSQADLAGAALQRMRAVGQALERQVASLRVQADEAAAMKKELAQTNERYKAEFLVLQRRWQEREKEIRKECELAMGRELETAKKELEAEKARIRLRAQEEIQSRVQKIEDGVRRQSEDTLKAREAALRVELEKELEDRAKRLQDALRREIDALRQELASRDVLERERLGKKDAENANLRSALDEIRGHLAKEQEWRKQLAADKERLERESQLRHEDAQRAQGAAVELRARVASLEKLVAEGETRHREVTGGMFLGAPAFPDPSAPPPPPAPPRR